MKTLATLLIILPLVACGNAEVADQMIDPTDRQESYASFNMIALGQDLFLDTSLSEPAGESCATCHDPNHTFIDARLGSDGKVTPTSEGAVAGLFGPRNTPSIIYASYIPPLSAAGDETGYAGGLFWDGRAISLEVQSQAPVLNPIEMGNPDQATLIGKIQKAPYAGLFKTVFGQSAFSDVGQAFNYMATAIATFERKSMPNRFTSKYDFYLAGKASLTADEAAGLALWQDPKTGGGTAGCLTLPDGTVLCGCAQCHLLTPASDGTPPLLTDFGYDNLGIPKNPNNQFYLDPPQYNPDGASYIDHGLSGSLHNPRQDGKFKAPSLRNVALTAPYGHNGYFADLASIVHFYNTRDVPSAGWPPPEVSFQPNILNMGNLGLTATEEAELVAFMNTLTDGYVPAAQKGK